MISSVELQIGGTKIDKHYGQWMQLWSDLSRPTDQDTNHNGLVGTEDATIAAGATLELFVPLQFFCCTEQRGEVRMFSPVKATWPSTPSAGDLRKGIPRTKHFRPLVCSTYCKRLMFNFCPFPTVRCRSSHWAGVSSHSIALSGYLWDPSRTSQVPLSVDVGRTKPITSSDADAVYVHRRRSALEQFFAMWIVVFGVQV